MHNARVQNLARLQSEPIFSNMHNPMRCKIFYKAVFRYFKKVTLAFKSLFYIFDTHMSKYVFFSRKWFILFTEFT